MLSPSGNLKIDRCPITREDLEPKVYPQVKLKAKLNRMQIGRLNQLIFIANSFKHDETKFNAALERAEKILSHVKEDVYKAEASKVAKLMLNSPYLRSPNEQTRCFVRVINTLHGEQRTKFVNAKMQYMYKK